MAYISDWICRRLQIRIAKMLLIHLLSKKTYQPLLTYVPGGFYPLKKNNSRIGSILIYDILILLFMYDILISLESIISYIHLPLFTYLPCMSIYEIYINIPCRELTYISHLGKGKIIDSKSTLLWDMLIPRGGLYHVICLANMTHMSAKHDQKKQSLVW